MRLWKTLEPLSGGLMGYRDGDRVMAEVRGAKSGPALTTPGLGFVASQSVSSARS